MTNSLEQTRGDGAEQTRGDAAEQTLWEAAGQARGDADERRRPGKRQRLIAAASQLLHQHGVEKTTLADIAQAADVPVGNVYYYFKTKDDIITAVIEAHVQQSR